MSWDIGPGSDVSMYYSIRLEDGTVADSSETEEPLQFTMGDGTLVRGLELALYGLWPGQKQTIRIPANEAYGYPDNSKKKVLEHKQFPSQMQIKVGNIVAFAAGEEEIPGTITAIEGDNVHVDFNHPLAGHEIEFNVEIITVGPAIGMEEE